jgi:glutamate/tyrosine decarboxylase-like PLP-dependent enzyme
MEVYKFPAALAQNSLAYLKVKEEPLDYPPSSSYHHTLDSMEDRIRVAQERILTNFARKRTRMEERHLDGLKELEEEKNNFLRRVTDGATEFFHLGMRLGKNKRLEEEEEKEEKKEEEEALTKI